MKTEAEILSIIADGIAQSVSQMEEYGDYNVIVCSERIFLDDYAPKVEDYIARISVDIGADGSYDLGDEGYEDPIQMPYQHTIFFVLKLGQGEINFAVFNCPISIQIVSEENSLDAARAMMMAFIRERNFRYIDGIVQSYFTPEVSSSDQEMYAGFRGLYSVRGSVKVPDDGIMFITNVMVKMEEDLEPFELPFLTATLDHSAQPDPQAFSGNSGMTMSINRMTTQAVSITTYLWNGEDGPGRFSKAVIGAMTNMNRKFRIICVSNVEDDHGDAIAVCDDTFILTNAHYSQEWGDIAPWSLTFAKSKAEVE